LKQQIEMESEIRQHYRAIKPGLPEGTPITVLHIGAEQTAVATGTGADPDQIILIAIGSPRTASECFKHLPPTPGELETAIMIVEDEVTKVRALTAVDSTLFTTDASISEIAFLAGITDGAGMKIPVDTVEHIFQLLASLSLGRPAPISGIPNDASFASTLLILREFMHHLKFSSITVVT
jgi:exopolyphosphatase/pppGpp-phosphohydrolase